jgi:hypothetical protein
MDLYRHSWIALGAVLALLPAAHAIAQGKTPEACAAEIDRTERSIADARKQSAFKSDKGRQALTSADRSLNQARKHASKGESRNCVTAAQKSRAQLSSR